MTKVISIPLVSPNVPDITRLPSERSVTYLRKAWTLSRMSDVSYAQHSQGCVLIYRRKIVAVGTSTDSYDGFANAMRQIDAHESDYVYVRAFIVTTNRRTGLIVPQTDESFELTGNCPIGRIYHT